MNVWILPLESVETRYTCQWLESIPNSLYDMFIKQNKLVNISKDDFILSDKTVLKKHNNIISIIGELAEQDTTPGAFLNFSGTNIWKSSQLQKLAEHFRLGNIQEGDRILITDAWNPAILQIKYMIDLLGYEDVKIHAIWHAGQYDPQDFLGRCLPNKTWARATEQALFHAIDYNYFATNFHIDLFFNNVFPDQVSRDNNFKEFYLNTKKVIKSGQPHELMIKQLEQYKNIPKENIIIFPHRVAPEKQPEIFRDLANEFPDYKFIVCQDEKLTKKEYHELMAKSKIMFSCSLQETLGIGAMEAILVDTMPLLPDRLSYSEMYIDPFKYPSKWTESGSSYLNHKTDLVKLIKKSLEHSQTQFFKEYISSQRSYLLSEYMTGTKMFENIVQ